MKKSLIKKICFAGIGLICIFVVLNILLTYFLLIPFSVHLSEKQMADIAMSISNWEDYSDESVRGYIEQIDEDMNTQIIIADRDRNIICSTKISDYQKKSLGRDTTELFESRFEEIEQGKTIFFSKNDEQETNRIRIKVIKKIGDDRYVVLNRSYRSLQNAMQSAIVFEVLVGVVLSLFSAIIVYRFSCYMVVPIQKMTVTAEHISNLEFDLKVDVKTEDELGKLGNSINKMSKRLKKNMEMLQEDVENRKRLVRNLSHEIKSPIAVIMGYAERLRTVIAKNPEKALSYCEIISNESARVDKIVREMLELSRLECDGDILNRQAIYAEDFFADLRSRFQEENVGKQIEYIENYNAGDEFLADYNLIERAVYNLLNNAVAYGKQDRLRVEVGGRKNGDYYEFTVFNTGSSINEANSDSLWEPFVKEDKARSRGTGSGVGLSIVREIVEAHHGYYSVKNVENGVLFLVAVNKK